MSVTASLVLPLLVIVLFGVLFWLQQRRHRDRLRQLRAAMWQDCLSLLQGAELIQDDINFPRLEGYYRDLPVRLEPVADHVGYRKLPQLWLCATIRTPLPVAGVLDLLVRPENTEFYSSLWSLPVHVPLPTHWPSHALLRADCEEAVAVIPTLDAHIEMFADPRMKELVVSPRGVRVVCQLAQGQRADYSVLRRVQFGEAMRVPVERLRDLLDRQLSLIDAFQRRVVASPTVLP
jgi:hypothetical protein